MKILLHVIWFLGSLFLGLLIHNQLPITRLIPNFWLLGPAGDMIFIGLGLMLGCLIYVFSSSVSPKASTTYKSRLGRRFYYTFMVTYGVMVLFILFSGRDGSGGSIELVPFRSTMGTISWMVQGQINLPFAYALLIGNLILFAPLAYYLRPYFKSGWRCYGALLGIFIGLELLQFVTNRGAFDIDDVIKYSLGVPLGFWIRKLFP